MKYTDIPKPIRDQMNVDELIFGNAFCLFENGKYKRINPMKVKLNRDSREYEIIEKEIKGIDIQKAKKDIIYFAENVFHISPQKCIPLKKQGDLIISSARRYGPKQISISKTGVNLALIEYLKQQIKKYDLPIEIINGGK